MTAAIGPIIGGITSLMSLSAQKKAMAAQEKQAQLADQRERRKLLRQAQIVQGQAINTAASVGGLGSSGLIGGVSNVTNQAQSQIGYQNTSLQLSKQYNSAMQTAGMYDALGSVFSNMNLGSVGYGSSGFFYRPA